MRMNEEEFLCNRSMEKSIDILYIIRAGFGQIWSKNTIQKNKSVKMFSKC